MALTFEQFATNLAAVRARIAAACGAAGRPSGDVTLLPVTKTHPAEVAEFVARAGLKTVGENRVQEALEKIPHAPVTIGWELIGHLQSNKAKLAARHFARVQSVDSVKLVELLARAAAEAGRVLPVLLQLNAGNDPAKFGAELADAPALLEAALAKPSLRVDGLMTIAPLSDDPVVARRTFANLRTTRDALAARFGVPLRELSMGMTGDLELAIAEGSTLVRVGTALFGTRETPPPAAP